MCRLQIVFYFLAMQLRVSIPIRNKFKKEKGGHNISNSSPQEVTFISPLLEPGLVSVTWSSQSNIANLVSLEFQKVHLNNLSAPSKVSPAALQNQEKCMFIIFFSHYMLTWFVMLREGTHTN